MSGCSSKPSDGDGKQAIQNQINQDSQGRIKLVEFRKTNGQLAEVNAVKVYSLEFEAEIEFTGDCKWITGLGGSEMGFRTSQLPNKSLGALAQFAADDGMPGTIVKQGQQVKISGVIRFEKKENGWSVDGIDINHIIPLKESGNSIQKSDELTHQTSGSPFDAEASSCLDNLSSIYDPIRSSVSSVMFKIPVDDSGKPVTYILPSDSNSLSNLVAPNCLCCPSDKKNKIRYKIKSGIIYNDIEQPYIICPIHHFTIYADGVIKTSSGITLVKLQKGWFDASHACENMTPAELKGKVVNDLGYIDLAKNQWRLEKPLDDLQNNRPITDTSHATPSEDDLKRFLPKKQFPEHPPGGHYIINSVGQSPESSTYGTLSQLLQ